MRPTPEGVGNQVPRARVLAAVVASMRPTPEGVGNSRGGALARAASSMLQ